MTALLLLVVVVTAVTALAEYPPPEQPAGGYGKSSKYPPVDTANKPNYKKPEYEVPGADVKRANDAVLALFGTTNQLIKDLNTYQTFIGVAAERINLINQRVLPAITLDNSQIDASISLLEEMINSLRDRASRADVTVSAAVASANASSDVIRQQRAQVALIARNNTEDARRIAQFQDDLRNLETYFLKELDTQLAQLNSLLAKERQNLKTVTTFVDGRKCEYGSVTLVSEIDTVSVQFETEFIQPPTVDIVLSGYSSSINVPFFSHDDYPTSNSYPPRSTNRDYSKNGDDSSDKSNEQNVQMVVSDVTTRGFTARVINTSPVNFNLESTRGMYVACQNLNNELRL